ncbi:MAG: thioesterase family protein [Rikenellaceae bacterium]
MLEIGLTAQSKTEVNKNNTAIALGSGDLAVFATPAMIALMENAAMTAVAAQLEEGSTTVGTAMSASHIKASGVGAQIIATATVVAFEGRKITFKVDARDAEGVIGDGEHTRFVVDKMKFMQKVKSL